MTFRPSVATMERSSLLASDAASIETAARGGAGRGSERGASRAPAVQRDSTTSERESVRESETGEPSFDWEAEGSPLERGSSLGPESMASALGKSMHSMGTGEEQDGDGGDAVSRASGGGDSDGEWFEAVDKETGNKYYYNNNNEVRWATQE